jgi:hypothetical protein
MFVCDDVLLWMLMLQLETIDDNESQVGESRSNSRRLPEVHEQQEPPGAVAAAGNCQQSPAAGS